MTEQTELIGIRVIEPFDKREKVYALQYHCTTDVDCPLRDKGECINAGFLQNCIYGRVSRVTGWTRRARKYGAFVRKWQDRAKELPIKRPTSKRITSIGECIWLPYAHINHADGEKKGINFLGYTGTFRNGQPFMRKEHFTPQTIVKILELRPQALFGGTITPYVTEMLPTFLADLREYDRGIYNRVLRLKPEAGDIITDTRHGAVRLEWLYKTDTSGYATINGMRCYVYSSTKHIKFKLDSISEFPNAVGKVEVDVELPPDTLVHLDRDRYSYMKIMNRAREDNAIVYEEGG